MQTFCNHKILHKEENHLAIYDKHFTGLFCSSCKFVKGINIYHPLNKNGIHFNLNKRPIGLNRVRKQVQIRSQVSHIV